MFIDLLKLHLLKKLMHPCLSMKATSLTCSGSPTITMKRKRAGKATGDVLGPPNVRVANLARVSGASSAALRIVSATFVLTSCRTPSLEQLISRPETKLTTSSWQSCVFSMDDCTITFKQFNVLL
ncbi:hypothetical protein Q3G72_018189 [Acer saccharum]|nr:hypothetical protein Q3G72_018189 [Acer saccharum]